MEEGEAGTQLVGAELAMTSQLLQQQEPYVPVAVPHMQQRYPVVRLPSPPAMAAGHGEQGGAAAWGAQASSTRGEWQQPQQLQLRQDPYQLPAPVPQRPEAPNPNPLAPSHGSSHGGPPGAVPVPPGAGRRNPAWCYPGQVHMAEALPSGF